jgi:integrase
MPKRHTWGEFTSAVLALYDPPIRRIATRRKLEQVLAEFGEICRRPDDLTPGAIASWILAHPGRRPSTVSSLLGALSAACTYGRYAGLIRSNPFQFRSPRGWVDWSVPDLPPPVHSSAAIARVLEAADGEALDGGWREYRLRAVVYSAAYTGARRRELLGLAVADLDLVGATIAIRPNAARPLKTAGSAARLPIAAPLAEVLADWVPRSGSAWLFPCIRRRAPWLEGPVGAKALDELKALGLRAGVHGLTFQSLRHTFASLAEGWGLGELALQRILRHTSPRTQRTYRHELPDVLREAAAKIRFP